MSGENRNKPQEDKKSFPPGILTLEQVVVSLQKSFSRVNARTQTNLTQKGSDDGGRRPTARLGQVVHFTIKLRAEPIEDYISVTEKGSMELTLEGDLSTDAEFREEVLPPPMTP